MPTWSSRLWKAITISISFNEGHNSLHLLFRNQVPWRFPSPTVLGKANTACCKVSFNFVHQVATAVVCEQKNCHTYSRTRNCVFVRPTTSLTWRPFSSGWMVRTELLRPSASSLPARYTCSSLLSIFSVKFRYASKSACDREVKQFLLLQEQPCVHRAATSSGVVLWNVFRFFLCPADVSAAAAALTVSPPVCSAASRSSSSSLRSGCSGYESEASLALSESSPRSAASARVIPAA